MIACTFFGHHDCPSDIRPKLREIVVDLVENKNVRMFYVGNHGCFDKITLAVLREVQTVYPQVEYAVVLAYMPQGQNKSQVNYIDTIFPEGIENIPKRFAINWRNKWMIDRSDFVVTYVTHSWGGAAKFAEMASRRRKSIINVISAENSPVY